MTEGRVRRSCVSAELQTLQSHPRVGTPIEVPLPSTVRVALMLWLDPADRRRPLCDRIRQLQISHAGFEQHILQHILLGVGEIAFCLFAEYRESVNSLTSTEDIGTGLLTFGSHQSELHHRGHVKRSDQALE